MGVVPWNAIVRMSNYEQVGSPAWSLRRKRFSRFLDLLEVCGRRSVRILDIGGTARFWEIMGMADSPHQITLVNLFRQEVRHPNMTATVGDARSLGEFRRGQFDVVFSNSVIEHLGCYAAQQKMAAEVRRIGEKYFVQTPNYYFPVEPHFMMPMFHFLPKAVRRWLLRHVRTAWSSHVLNREQARRAVDEIRLLSRREVAALFPQAAIYPERVGGLVKSYVVVKD